MYFEIVMLRNLCPIWTAFQKWAKMGFLDSGVLKRNEKILKNGNQKVRPDFNTSIQLLKGPEIGVRPSEFEGRYFLYKVYSILS